MDGALPGRRVRCTKRARVRRRTELQACALYRRRGRCGKPGCCPGDVGL